MNNLSLWSAYDWVYTLSLALFVYSTVDAFDKSRDKFHEVIRGDEMNNTNTFVPTATLLFALLFVLFYLLFYVFNIYFTFVISVFEAGIRLYENYFGEIDAE